LRPSHPGDLKTRNKQQSGNLGHHPYCSVWVKDGHKRQSWKGGGFDTRLTKKFKQQGAQAVVVSGPTHCNEKQDVSTIDYYGSLEFQCHSWQITPFLKLSFCHVYFTMGQGLRVLSPSLVITQFLQLPSCPRVINNWVGSENTLLGSLDSPLQNRIQHSICFLHSDELGEHPNLDICCPWVQRLRASGVENCLDHKL
jgi:hypothetical protein